MTNRLIFFFFNGKSTCENCLDGNDELNIISMGQCNFVSRMSLLAKKYCDFAFTWQVTELKTETFKNYYFFLDPL